MQPERKCVLNKHNRVLITGATGALGPSVVQALHESGYSIRTLSVDVPPAGLFPPDVQIVVGDITDKVVVKSAVQGVDAVLHLAALLHIVNPPPAMRERYERVNVGGTANVVEAAAVGDAKRLVLFSTIAVYGSGNGQVLNELSPTHPESYYAETKLAAERIVLDAASKDGRPLGLVLRMGAVYGSRIKGNYQRLTQALSRRRFVPIGNGRNRRTLVYDKDVAAAAVLALKHPDAAGRIYNVTDGAFHTLGKIIEAISFALGRKPPRFALPEGAARFAAGTIEKGARTISLSLPNFRAMIEKYTEDVAVEGVRIRRELGFEPKFDLAEGWRQTIKDMRQTGQIQ